MRIGGIRPPGGRWRVPGRGTSRGGGGARGWRRSTVGSLAVALVLVAVALVVERVVPPLEGAVRVADGDSLDIDGTRVRLEGIDAPELHQSCGAPSRLWPCGQWAKQAMTKAVAGGVSCRPVDEDRYRRAVSVCRIGGDGAEGRDLGARLVEEGWAVATSLAYRREEAAARAAERGIWSGPFEMPTEFRARGRGDS